MTTHQQKKLDVDALKAFRDRFALPLDDEAWPRCAFINPPTTAPSSAICTPAARRSVAICQSAPTRAPSVAVPALTSYAKFALEPDAREISTTTAIVRLFTNLLKDKELGPRIVPIVADEARTFGMANLFRQVGIYSPLGQLYEPEDAGSMLYYKESKDGQLLEEGITEAGAISSWVAAATSYSVNGVAMLPFYIYYSMFGFQRVGDLIWAAADQRARGFLIGATAGRTTLSGEGLQHQDGTSHLIASTVPNCRAYDPAFSSEVAVIVDHGSRRMLEAQHDEFYYLTVTNENYAQAPLDEAAHADVIKGMRRFGVRGSEGTTPAVRLLGSGAILREVIAAADLLAADWDIASEIWSVTSFSELARDARGVERDAMFGASSEIQSHVARCLAGDAPVVAASDYVRAYPQLISSYIKAPYIALGTDGFGRSDTRPALRRFFEVDRYHIALAALSTLDPAKHAQALKRYDIEIGPDAPWNR